MSASRASCSDYSQTIFKSRQILLDIMSVRGYDVSDYQDFNMNEIHIMTQNKQLDMLLEKKEDTVLVSKIFIKYHLAKTLRPANVQEYCEDLYDVEEVLGKNDDLVLIIQDAPNDTINSLVRHIWDSEHKMVTIFSIRTLQFSILNHALVPPHSILTEEETKEYNAKYGITSSKQIPEIDRFDPVAKCIGIRPGQMCKITRKSKTAIKADFYRICS
jgi:DNA-directed RNA polymerase subunit H